MIGSVYALTAMGATLIYGILRILDIANAGAYAVGAYAGWYMYSVTENILFAFVFAMLFTGIIGVLVQKFIYFPIISKPNVIAIVPLITSVGLFTLTGDLLRLIFGPNVKNMNMNLKLDAVEIGTVRISAEWIFIVLLTTLLFFILWFILNKTKLGLAWRATAADTEIAKTMGVNVHVAMGLSYVLGYGFAAAAGTMVGVLYNAIYPTMGDIPSYKMLAIIVLGGLGNPLGTVIAGIVIGLSETLVSAYFGSIMPRDVIAFLVLIIVLLVKPSGLVTRKNS
jgi:branched-chain amino acid transport system permease protein